MSLPSITERLSKDNPLIDQLPILEGLKLMLRDQSKAVSAIEKILPEIEKTINNICEKLNANKKSRLIYCGAGTSGRIGVQDGVELNPTFSWPLKRLDFILAGRKKALMRPIEDSEDDILDAKKQFDKKNINSDDVIFGISASGDTEFTNEIMKLSLNKQALTVTISNNPNGNLIKYGNFNLILDTKEEILAGSTRLKAGTAQKICLNLISTSVMTKLGFVKNGMMSHLLPVNKKLRKRQKFIKSKINF